MLPYSIQNLTLIYLHVIQAIFLCFHCKLCAKKSFIGRHQLFMSILLRFKMIPNPRHVEQVQVFDFSLWITRIIIPQDLIQKYQIIYVIITLQNIINTFINMLLNRRCIPAAPLFVLKHFFSFIIVGKVSALYVIITLKNIINIFINMLPNR